MLDTSTLTIEPGGQFHHIEIVCNIMFTLQMTLCASFPF
jgi:hypothetical protein